VLCFWYKVNSLRALVDIVADRAQLANSSSGDDDDDVKVEGTMR